MGCEWKKDIILTKKGLKTRQVKIVISNVSRIQVFESSDSAQIK
jgi:hypothetical protein